MFKFDDNLDHQKPPIEAVVKAVKGNTFDLQKTSIPESKKSDQLDIDKSVVSNPVLLSNDLFLQTIAEIQKENNIDPTSEIKSQEACPNLTIEMETGTGKTYVYLRTLFELNKIGYKKFIILVPSIAIREGVLQSLRMMQEHFAKLYSANVSFFSYSSKDLTKLANFATDRNMEIMVINKQAIDKDFTAENIEGRQEDTRSNVMYRQQEKLGWNKPVEFIQPTRPVLVMDEPQSIGSTDITKNAIKRLNPSLILRYSATHKETYNLLYSLNPIQAYDQNLVKKIEVAAIVVKDYYNEPYVEFLKVIYVGKRLKAKIKIHKQQEQGIVEKEMTVMLGSDLHTLSGKRNLYQGYQINEIDKEYIKFANGKKISVGKTNISIKDKIQKSQIKKCVETHFEKTLAVKGKGIKVLSLFFIDRVANYRNHETNGLGKFGEWFEEAFKACTKDSNYKKLIPYDVRKVHGGYFAKDKKGKGKEKDTSGKTADDTHAFELIMKDKETLLSQAEPLQFIFSHSALREGWDNPNVFQICTLNESTSYVKKRQEIGRGLRLPVNSEGERIKEDGINCLTVIANESYEAFATALQKEIEDDTGIVFDKEKLKNKEERKKVKISFHKEVFLNEDFKKLWDKISHKTRYCISYEIQKIVKETVKNIKQKLILPSPQLAVEKGDAFKEHLPSNVSMIEDISITRMPDLIAGIQKNVPLTRGIIAEILKKSTMLDEAKKNPEFFIPRVSDIINDSLHDIIKEGVRYKKIPSCFYELDCIQWSAETEIARYIKNLYEVKKRKEKPQRTLYSHIACDSEFECGYAKKLDDREEVKIFVKLPSWFKIDTPVGTYNPDWAIVQNGDEKLYLIRETKGVEKKSELRTKEEQKTEYGEKHCEALDVGYRVITEENINTTEI